VRTGAARGGGGTGSGEIIEHTALGAETVKEEVESFSKFEEIAR
jgi:hypothetical protein